MAKDSIPAEQGAYVVIAISDDRVHVEDFTTVQEAEAQFFQWESYGFRDVLYVYRHKGNLHFYQGMWTGYAKRDEPQQIQHPPAESSKP